MPHYFLIWDADQFHTAVRPALAASWSRRSFEPCRALCRELEPATREYAGGFGMAENEPLVSRVARGLPFDRHRWRCLVGEVVCFGAEEMPEVQTSPDTLYRLLGEHPTPEALPRGGFAPVHQVFFGTHDLAFGRGLYRPDHAGYNDAADVTRLAEHLAGLDPRQWHAEALATLPHLADAAERAEEVAFAREWFPELRDLYRRAADRGRVVIGEAV